MSDNTQKPTFSVVWPEKDEMTASLRRKLGIEQRKRYSDLDPVIQERINRVYDALQEQGQQYDITRYVKRYVDHDTRSEHRAKVAVNVMDWAIGRIARNDVEWEKLEQAQFNAAAIFCAIDDQLLHLKPQDIATFNFSNATQR